MLEEDEIFYLTVNSSSLPNDIVAGSPFQAIVTIIDDDCKEFLIVFVYRYIHIYIHVYTYMCVYLHTHTIAAVVNFSQSMYSVNEDDTMIQLMLILSNPSSTDFTVNVLNTDESTSEC